MLDKLKHFFEQKLSTDSVADEEQRLKSFELAGAALMVEIMEADHELDDSESAEFVRVLEESFKLAPEEIDIVRQWLEDCASTDAVAGEAVP